MTNPSNEDYFNYVSYIIDFGKFEKGWYYRDEADQWQGPYDTKDEAIEAFDYWVDLLG